MALSAAEFLMRSRWVRIPITLGNRVIGTCREIQRFPVLLYLIKRFWSLNLEGMNDI